MIILIVEKTFDKVQHPLMIKTLRKVGIEGAFLNLIKAIKERPHTHTQWAKTKIFPTKIRNKIRLSTFTTSIQHCIGSPSHSNRKGNKRHPNWKGENKTVIVCR